MANLSQFFGDAVASGQSEYTTDARLLPVGVYHVPYIKTWSNYTDGAHEQVFWYNSLPRMFNMYDDQWATVYSDYTWANPNFKNDNATNHTQIDNFEAATNSDIDGGYVIVDYNTQQDTWVDVCNHSGFGGYLGWVIGLGNHGAEVGGKSYIKITVDGVEYEFVGNLHYRNGSATSSHERLLWGCLMSTSTTSNPFAGGMFGANHSSLGVGSHHRSYYYTRNSMGVYTHPEESVNVPLPDEFIPGKGFIPLRFDNSIRVQVKISHPNNSYALPSQGANTQTSPYFSNYAAACIKRDLVIPGF